MSRIGRLPITIPSGVKISIVDQHITVNGPKGKLDWVVPHPIAIKEVESQIVVERPNDERKNRALHGTSRALIANMVQGVTQGYQRKLEINGVGYRANVQGSTLNLELGYSHPVKYLLPDGVKAEVEANTRITLSSIDKRLLGQTAAEVRELRPPEPYKGKGIKYADEHIRRKVGKKNA